MKTDGAVLSGGGGGRGVKGAVWALKGGKGGASGVDRARNSGTAHLYPKLKPHNIYRCSYGDTKVIIASWNTILQYQIIYKLWIIS